LHRSIRSLVDSDGARGEGGVNDYSANDVRFKFVELTVRRIKDPLGDAVLSVEVNDCADGHGIAIWLTPESATELSAWLLAALETVAA
jgi:hypothetical protein